MIKYFEYRDPQKFMDVCHSYFGENEAFCSLMLGISLRLVKNPLHYGTKPFLATMHKNDKLSLIAIMTPPHKLQITLIDKGSYELIELLVIKLSEKNWEIPGVLGEEKAVRIFDLYWTKIAGKKGETGMKQRLYILRNVNKINLPSGSFRKAKLVELDLAYKWSLSFHKDCIGEKAVNHTVKKDIMKLINNEKLYFWQDTDPVSMACITRPTVNGCTIALVYTPDRFRNKRYGTAVVSKLSQLILEKGKKFCTLYTDLSNPASNHLYQRIGYKAVADFIDINFRNNN